ncbi:DUF3800 domain-containing protein [Corynebacterium sp. MC-17D]|uniref:DUF3800 domain-containing protein n=1 Tax=Corynebacterium lipophilum TaxID=2804918 RepID=A0AAW5HWA0_9CORY|nr:DUF3800 domain-containing protein [Corynebacterium lipophilum]MCO6394454.1 DUF3800 domain-containing protein [Corynebacterium lipophilum]MCZ2117451.1 DUF3800 domain-containing protein [Corynebacterium lipophilum]
MTAQKKPYSLPNRVDVSTIYIDESGAKNSRGGFFVVGFVKVREPYLLARTIRHLRQKYRFYGEIHFAQISKNQLPFYFDLVEELAIANVRVGVQSTIHNDPLVMIWRLGSNSRSWQQS